MHHDRKLTDVAVVVEAISLNSDVLHKRQTQQQERIGDLSSDVRTDGARLNRVIEDFAAFRSDCLKANDDLWLQAGRLPLQGRTFLGRLRWLVTGR